MLSLPAESLNDAKAPNASPLLWLTEPRDPILDVLLDPEGLVLVVDPKGDHWVRLVVTRVPVSPEKPHGIDYSLTLHGPDREGLLASTMPIR